MPMDIFISLGYIIAFVALITGVAYGFYKAAKEGQP